MLLQLSGAELQLRLVALMSLYPRSVPDPVSVFCLLVSFPQVCGSKAAAGSSEHLCSARWRESCPVRRRPSAGREACLHSGRTEGVRKKGFRRKPGAVTRIREKGGGGRHINGPVHTVFGAASSRRNKVRRGEEILRSSGSAGPGSHGRRGRRGRGHASTQHSRPPLLSVRDAGLGAGQKSAY